MILNSWNLNIYTMTWLLISKLYLIIIRSLEGISGSWNQVKTQTEDPELLSQKISNKLKTLSQIPTLTVTREVISSRNTSRNLFFTKTESSILEHSRSWVQSTVIYKVTGTLKAISEQAVENLVSKTSIIDLYILLTMQFRKNLTIMENLKVVINSHIKSSRNI